MRVLFWGTPVFAVPTLRALIGEGHEVVGVVTQPDRPAGRGRKLTPSPIREVARAEGIPVLTPERPRGDDFLARIGALDPEISVVVAYGHILLPEVLEFPPRGSWNVHASLLPELRGAAPIHWAVARGHEKTGISVMRMTKGMDAGPVLHQVEEPIDPLETSDELAERLSEIGAQAMIEALALLEFGDAEPVEQDHDAATFAPKVSREVARIDWSRPAAEVINHIRAMDSIPGAWTTWEGQPLKVFRPNPEAPENVTTGPADGKSGAGPGQAAGGVVAADPSVDRGLGVRCGDGRTVWIDEVQPPGKTRMPTAAWLRGRGADVGDRFE